MARSRRRRSRPLTTIDVEVLGVEELAEVFRRLPTRAQRTIITEGLRAGADIVLREEARHVPIRAGTLFQSLQIGKIRHGAKRSRVSIGVGPEGFYGRFLEYGTQHMPARPWLRPALDTAFRPTVAAVREEVRTGLDPMVRDLAHETGSG